MDVYSQFYIQRDESSVVLEEKLLKYGETVPCHNLLQASHSVYFSPNIYGLDLDTFNQRKLTLCFLYIRFGWSFSGGFTHSHLPSALGFVWIWWLSLLWPGFSPAAEASVAAVVSPAEPATAALQTPWHGTGTGAPPAPQSSAPWKLHQTVLQEGCRLQASRQRNSLQLNSSRWGNEEFISCRQANLNRSEDYQWTCWRHLALPVFHH